MTADTETAILAGGCFWPAQELLRHRTGVISTRVGYTGGENDNPTAFFDHSEVQVALLLLGRKTRRRPATLGIENHAGNFSHRSQANLFYHQTHAGATGRSGRFITGITGA